ncbi:hemerythrin domain-containing protein [Corynebacterium halotolerans]|uniref:hemerythrin domain-containing protein n=1 Tax=Corynebacterium halotolerans TaxID=225326 RepID=UPI003CECD2F7
MTESHDPNNSSDVTVILTIDHREMLELFGRIHTTTDPEERRDLADAGTAEVMRHSVAEEMFVYPEMEKHLPNGSEEVEHDKKEHDELVQAMKKLEGLEATDPAFLDQVSEVEKLLDHHAHDEEDEQFPKLRQHFDQDKLNEMGEKVQQAKKVAPTRPHPSAPHSELFHKTVGAGVGMVDRLRDKLMGRETNS